MINDEWNRDPAKWSQRPLHERLEMLRKYHCTGPCGQSAGVLGDRTALNEALQQARDMAAFNLQRLEMATEKPKINYVDRGSVKLLPGYRSALERE